jgi:murein L,D-transpeptidase YcbB/YkuD
MSGRAKAAKADISVKALATASGAVLAAVVVGLQATAQPGPAQPRPPAQAPVAAVQTAAPQPFRADQIELIVKTLDQAESHGFTAGVYGTDAARRLLASADPDDQARGQAALRRTLTSYAAAQHGQRILAVKTPDDWALKPAPYDAGAALDAALASDRLGPWLDSLAPAYPAYDQLRIFLARYRKVAADGGWGTVPDGPALKPGMTDAQVAALRARLAMEDASVVADPNPVYDPQLVEAVKRFQLRQGFNADGVVGRGTRAALNVPVEARVEQIRANLERWRWLPRGLPPTRVDVNIPGAHLTFYRDNRPTLEMKAVAGKPGAFTPMLQSTIHTVVLNPPWNVPESIASKELWPKARANPGYFEQEGYEVISAGGGSRIQQRPGPNNALGQVKFDFDNPFAVYLHDTPNKAAFQRDVRALSHGCVRLERPMDLAKALFNGQSNWGEQKIDEVLAGGETVKAQLAADTPVFLLYWTAYVDAQGVINFRTDVYNWDRALLGLLDAGRNRV